MIERIFIPGSEWLYIKLYTGCVTADYYIANKLKSLSSVFVNEGLVSQFFFIRYQDPDFHIRIRYKISQTASIVKILNSFNDFFSEDLYCELISKIQIDTYKREIERYDDVLMDDTEMLFYIDSIYTCDLLSHLHLNGNNELVRLLLSMHSTNLYLDAFGLDTVQKKEMMNDISDNFKREFKGRYDVKNINSFYQSNKQFIRSFMLEQKNSELGDYLQELYDIQNQRKKRTSELAVIMKSKVPEKTIYQIIPSYIHMMNNRLFISNQREYELVSYTCLYKFYDSMVAQNIDF